MGAESQATNPFERIEEYKAVLEDTAQASNHMALRYSLAG